MTLTTKLQLEPGEPVLVVNAPAGLALDVPRTRSRSAHAVIAFARTRAELEERVAPMLEAAREDRLAWIAYPKAGQLETDLSRDVVWRLLEPRGVKPVRQVAIDDVWSALRFRPAREAGARAAPARRTRKPR